jgi:hypothetical protein
LFADAWARLAALMRGTMKTPTGKPDWNHARGGW